MNYSMRETHSQANKETLYLELPTELEALKESPELTVKLKLFLT